MLFEQHKLERKVALMAVSAGEAVVSASELATTCSKIAELQRVFGKKTLENDNVERSSGVRC